jgi:hypothetical protein
MDVAGDKTYFLTLDDANVLSSAVADPIGCVRGLDRAVIDEVQRAPDQLLAIKNLVDFGKSPGRFLLTGSADLVTLPKGLCRENLPETKCGHCIPRIRWHR